MLEILEIKGIPLVMRDDNLATLILESLENQKIELRSKDILVIAQSIVSKSEGRVVELYDVAPSHLAKKIAKQTSKDPRLVELILQESKKIIAIKDNHIITETHHGFICANAGIDRSNSKGIGRVTLLPIDSDKSATMIRNDLLKQYGVSPAVIITDSHGRPFRIGAISIAIGLAGIESKKSFVGKQDLYGYTLKTEVVSQGDQIASAAGLLMGESDEGIPVVLIRGYDYKSSESSAGELIRPEEKDIFRLAAIKQYPKVK
ncbi:MAG: coenzyme F420-0:L-glutamate ligase [Candidatus Ranarchaeia archaeon]